MCSWYPQHLDVGKLPLHSNTSNTPAAGNIHLPWYIHGGKSKSECVLYSRKLLRDKTFMNVTILQPPAVFSTPIYVDQFNIPQKFSPQNAPFLPIHEVFPLKSFLLRGITRVNFHQINFRNRTSPECAYTRIQNFCFCDCDFNHKIHKHNYCIIYIWSYMVKVWVLG